MAETDTLACQCTYLTELEGDEAERYARGHLRRMSVEPRNWQAEYLCRETGQRWLMDFPRSYLPGGGPPRLRLLRDEHEPHEITM